MSALDSCLRLFRGCKECQHPETCLKNSRDRPILDKDLQPLGPKLKYLRSHELNEEEIQFFKKDLTEAQRVVYCIRIHWDKNVRKVCLFALKKLTDFELSKMGNITWRNDISDFQKVRIYLDNKNVKIFSLAPDSTATGIDLII